MRLLACTLLLLLSLVGCSAESTELSDERNKKPATVKLTHVDLYKGDGAKFRPFLGAMSGAFKLEYKGTKPNIHLDIDIWEDGKKVSSAGSVGDLFFSSEDKARDELEIIIAINTINIKDQDQYKEIEINLMGDSGYSFVTFTTPWDEKYTLQGLISTFESQTFPADETVYVWGMHASSTNSIPTADLSPESLNRLEKAIIFTLRFEEHAAEL